MKKYIIAIMAFTLVISSCDLLSGDKDEKIKELENKLSAKDADAQRKLELELHERELALAEREKNANKQKPPQKKVVKSSPQKRIAVINDPDGYTNVRSGMSTKSEIIDRLYEGEHYEVYPTSKTNWWRVKTQNYVKGYVHKSRIRIID